MSITFDTAQVDTRAVLTAHGQKCTILEKTVTEDGQRYLVVDFDETGIAFRTAEQFTAIDEPAPAPTMRRSAYKGVSEFWFGGVHYRVDNAVDNAYPVSGFYRVWAVGQQDAPNLVRGAKTKKAAFQQALEILGAPAAA
ncbi:hypothetical protein SUDANB1_05616 [Streptomyces sp. enrichment culture]|uniref:hypothetical protein n=1 Tax=Streptomyces sp. enrichment culture TaxID=1795815 RepID=UPI003F552A40